MINILTEKQRAINDNAATMQRSQKMYPLVFLSYVFH